jgi:hypothetical protein
MELVGLEPTTSCMPWNYAISTPPYRYAVQPVNQRILRCASEHTRAAFCSCQGRSKMHPVAPIENAPPCGFAGRSRSEGA